MKKDIRECRAAGIGKDDIHFFIKDKDKNKKIKRKNKKRKNSVSSQDFQS
jgi:hypothetical protein